jgi:aspartate aminotransferase
LNEAGVATASPEGGFYLFPDFAAWRDQLARRGIHGSDQLCTALLEEAGVALLPGTAFGMPAQELVARLSYVNFDGDLALQPDADLEQVAQPVLEGIGAINHWLTQQGQEAA